MLNRDKILNIIHYYNTEESRNIKHKIYKNIKDRIFVLECSLDWLTQKKSHFTYIHDRFYNYINNISILHESKKDDDIELELMKNNIYKDMHNNSNIYYKKLTEFKPIHDQLLSFHIENHMIKLKLLNAYFVQGDPSKAVYHFLKTFILFKYFIIANDYKLDIFNVIIGIYRDILFINTLITKEELTLIIFNIRNKISYFNKSEIKKDNEVQPEDFFINDNKIMPNILLYNRKNLFGGKY